MTKEQNFISAVVAIQDDSPKTLDFFKELYRCLDEHFLQFEIIAINEGCKANHAENLRAWAKETEKPFTMIHMSIEQPHEQCMNAGLDCSIGDYIYEFDSVDMPYSPELIWEAYALAQKGHDIVSVCPSQERLGSRCFYWLFNRHSHASYQLRTDAFRIVSRRTVNRVHAISENLPYRKAAYASCGLDIAELEFPGRLQVKHKGRFELATDSLVLYTDWGYKFSLGLTLLMTLVTLSELIYTLVIWTHGHPIAGWTTTMFVITFGLTGLFCILAILLKYLTLLLKVAMKKQNYLVSEIEKL